MRYRHHVSVNRSTYESELLGLRPAQEAFTSATLQHRRSHTADKTAQHTMPGPKAPL